MATATRSRGTSVAALPGRVYLYVALRGLSVFGDAAWLLAATWALINTGGAARVGLFLAVVSTVGVGLMVPASIITSRCGLRRVMIVCDVGAGVVALAAVVACALIGPEGWLIFATGILLAAVEACYRPAAGAFVRTVATDEFLTRALALGQSVSSMAGIIGTVAGGALVAFAGLGSVLVVNAATFALIAAGLVVGFAKSGGSAVPRAKAPKVLRSTFRRLWRHQLVRVSLIRNAAVNLLGMGLLNVGLVAFVQANGWSAVQLAVVEGAISVGVIAGGTALSRAREPLRPFHLAALLNLAFSPAVLCLVTVPAFGVCVAAAVVTGVSVVVMSAYATSAMYKALPIEDMVVTNAVTTGISMAGIPLGQLLAGALIATTSVLTANLAFGVTLCATALLLWAASVHYGYSAEPTPSSG